MYISPKTVIVGDVDITTWEIERKVNLFHEKIDGWHLEVADRVINGWEVDGKECIVARHLDGRPANYVIDSGWAVLQMVFNYFEVVATYKQGKAASQKKSGELFKAGFLEVFPQFRGHKPDIARFMWKSVRTGLYHYVMPPDRLILSHTVDSKPLEYLPNEDLIVIDPHKFIPALREHLRAYCADLKNPANKDLRKNFEEVFDKKYG